LLELGRLTVSLAASRIAAQLHGVAERADVQIGFHV
jgi:hypothetical protein